MAMHACMQQVSLARVTNRRGFTAAAAADLCYHPTCSDCVAVDKRFLTYIHTFLNVCIRKVVCICLNDVLAG